jgi:uncharacterized membrane protein
MFNLIAASAYFLIIHFGVSGTRLRDALVARLGEGRYRGAFALASVIGLVWMIYTYRHAPTVSKLAEGTDIARGMVRITRHPFLWGVALWALVHLIVNGDLASFILFGSFLLLALGGTAAIDAKRRRKFGDGWAQFAQTTSSVPFVAILSGRNSIVSALGEIGIVRPLVAVLAYALIFYFHGRVFGAPLV